MSAPEDVSSDAFRHFSRLALAPYAPPLPHCLKGKRGSGCRLAMGSVHLTQDYGRAPRETNSILELVHGVHLQSDADKYPGDSSAALRATAAARTGDAAGSSSRSPRGGSANGTRGSAPMALDTGGGAAVRSPSRSSPSDGRGPRAVASMDVDVAGGARGRGFCGGRGGGRGGELQAPWRRWTWTPLRHEAQIAEACRGRDPRGLEAQCFLLRAKSRSAVQPHWARHARARVAAAPPSPPEPAEHRRSFGVLRAGTEASPWRSAERRLAPGRRAPGGRRALNALLRKPGSRRS